MPLVMIVDDDDITCDLVRRMVESMGYSVIVSFNGQSAIDLAEEVKPDLIVMDLLLPNGINGWDAAEAIRAIPDLQNVPIIAMTAASGLISPLDVFDELIRKPFNVKGVEELIREFLEK